MERKYLKYMVDWKSRSNRKPLVLRGARQVGKTYLVREFAARYFDYLVEINFDETPEKVELFRPSDIEVLLRYIATDTNTPVIPGKTLIFLDEIQKAPELFAKLRYFYEKKADLHIIAAGSLLDFILAEHEFSMPVGRIEYLFMGPMDFSEFLRANDQGKLLEFIQSFRLDMNIPVSIHQKLIEWQRIYMAIGGMPAAVREYSAAHSFGQVDQELSSVIQTYRDDFAKYRKRIHAERLRMVLDRLPHLVGRKLKYVDLCREERAKDLHESINMLQMARIVHCVHHSSGNALPLSAQRRENDFKPLLIDVGIMMNALGLRVADILGGDLMLSNRGAVAEQFIGQQLLYREVGYREPRLYYWNREKRGAAAEVDYLLTFRDIVVPVEVKAGTTGTLKSMHVFATEKSSPIGIRFNLDTPSITRVDARVMAGKTHDFILMSLPMYMVSETERLLNDALGDYA